MQVEIPRVHIGCSGRRFIGRGRCLLGPLNPPFHHPHPPLRVVARAWRKKRAPASPLQGQEQRKTSHASVAVAGGLPLRHLLEADSRGSQFRFMRKKRRGKAFFLVLWVIFEVAWVPWDSSYYLVFSRIYSGDAFSSASMEEANFVTSGILLTGTSLFSAYFRPVVCVVDAFAGTCLY